MNRSCSLSRSHACQPAGDCPMTGQLRVMHRGWGGGVRIADPEGPFWDSESMLSLARGPEDIYGACAACTAV